MRKVLFFVVVVFFACSCQEEVKEPTPNAGEELSQLLSDYSEEGYSLNPLIATSAGDNRFNDQFPDFLSESYKAKSKEYFTKYKKAVLAIDDSLLTDTELMSKKVLLWECDMNLDGFQFRKDLMPIDQMWSANLDFNQLASGTTAQPFKTVEDYDNWLKRVDGYLVWLTSAKKNMKEGSQKGYVLPKTLIVKVIPQFESLAHGPVEDHLFYSPIKLFPDSFSDEEKSRLTQAYSEMVENKIIPAYADMATYLKEAYLPLGRESSGMAATPLGDSYYPHQIKKYTTTNMSADEIHNLGLSEVARIRGEMEAVKKQVGFEGDLNSFFDYIRNNKELMPFTERSQVLAFYDSIHKVMQPQLDKMFGKQPKTAFEVRRTEPFREKSAAANYSPGSLDGTRPGIFYTPIPNVEEYNVFDKEDLFLHEAIPGHHFQCSLQQENEDLPMFRKTLWYSAYGEGWALYSESLGTELGLYKDPYQYFGMLSSEIHRAIRLVVDTGIHAKGWTREEAIKYSLENEAEDAASIESEIERYMANPGQALSYKIGQLKIIEMRKKAEQELGDKFDIKDFHDQILETGCVPLALLEERMNQWIASAK
ncbi:DUF885 domain-containing protein [Mangrovimonas sp. AS39]|uniref:DUF885 domain-containing protein n=1 Tax=Mangrovimonas futianensis TaxID=2895523 RepID=UPI001E394A04|nr:DUF885 domain-containing protein [Mangrovimonas futianensis]MCF1192662.1 DUF885 domain-containing protein [Mangrovimonas futianensis]MCF1196417.1 DUF885 domain-containing protein [Mangrovimonas futianensis]